MHPCVQREMHEALLSENQIMLLSIGSLRGAFFIVSVFSGLISNLAGHRKSTDLSPYFPGTSLKSMKKLEKKKEEGQLENI